MTNHFVLNRREHFYMYTNRIAATVSIVLIQNVTVICLLNRPKPKLQSAKTRRPRFSFFSYSIVK